MAEIENTLDKMDRINSDIYVAIRRTDKDRNKDLLALRGQFAAETGNLIRLIATDSRLSARRDVAEDMSNRLFEVRQKLAQHQAKWRSVSIDENYAQYLSATNEVNSEIKDYLRWAKGMLVMA
jgi:hypothetical protein